MEKYKKTNQPCFRYQKKYSFHTVIVMKYCPNNPHFPEIKIFGRIRLVFYLRTCIPVYMQNKNANLGGYLGLNFCLVSLFCYCFAGGTSCENALQEEHCEITCCDCRNW